MSTHIFPSLLTGWLSSWPLLLWDPVPSRKQRTHLKGSISHCHRHVTENDPPGYSLHYVFLNLLSALGKGVSSAVGSSSHLKNPYQHSYLCKPLYSLLPITPGKFWHTPALPIVQWKRRERETLPWAPGVAPGVRLSLEGLQGCLTYYGEYCEFSLLSENFTKERCCFLDSSLAEPFISWWNVSFLEHRVSLWCLWSLLCFWWGSRDTAEPCTCLGLSLSSGAFHSHINCTSVRSQAPRAGRCQGGTWVQVCRISKPFHDSIATFVRGLTYQRVVKKQKEREEEKPGKKKKVCRREMISFQYDLEVANRQH